MKRDPGGSEQQREAATERTHLEFSSKAFRGKRTGTIFIIGMIIIEVANITVYYYLLDFSFLEVIVVLFPLCGLPIIGMGILLHAVDVEIFDDRIMIRKTYLFFHRIEITLYFRELRKVLVKRRKICGHDNPRVGDGMIQSIAFYLDRNIRSAPYSLGTQQFGKKKMIQIEEALEVALEPHGIRMKLKVG